MPTEALKTPGQTNEDAMQTCRSGHLRKRGNLDRRKIVAGDALNADQAPTPLSFSFLLSLRPRGFFRTLVTGARGLTCLACFSFSDVSSHPKHWPDRDDLVRDLQPPSTPDDQISLNNLVAQSALRCFSLRTRCSIALVSSDDMSEWRLPGSVDPSSIHGPDSKLHQPSNGVPPAQPQFQRCAPVTEVRRISS